MKDCNHPNFEVNASVARFADPPESVPTGYMLDVKCRCIECGIPFQFIGIRSGISTDLPNVSIDATELRIPIKPSGDPVDLAQSIANQ